MTDSTSSSSDRCIDRRTLLASLGAGTIGLSGCLTDSSSTDSDVFEDIWVDGSELRVRLTSETSADWVYRHGPDGSQADKAMVNPEGRETWFDLVGQHADGYEPGTHRVVAHADGESLGETTIDLEPAVRLTGFRWAKNYPDMDWDKLSTNWETSAAFSLKNLGTGPTMVSQTRWQNAPFNFRTDGNEETFERSVLISADETTTVYAEPPVYETGGAFFGPSPVACEDLDRETLHLTVELEPGSDLTHSETIEYGGKKGECDLEMVDSSLNPTSGTAKEEGR